MPNLFYAAFLRRPLVDPHLPPGHRPPRAWSCYQWFVREDAEPGVDFDVDKLIEVGHVTQSEDNDAHRAHPTWESSRRFFTPGPLSADLEAALHDFVANYLKYMD